MTLSRCYLGPGGGPRAQQMDMPVPIHQGVKPGKNPRNQGTISNLRGFHSFSSVSSASSSSSPSSSFPSKNHALLIVLSCSFKWLNSFCDILKVKLEIVRHQVLLQRTSGKLNVQTQHTPQSEVLRRLRQVNCLSSGVQSQPEQQSETYK